jgi:hypothetical protein
MICALSRARGSDGCAFHTPGGHRVAIYELTRPGVAERLAGRRDF